MMMQRVVAMIQQRVRHTLTLDLIISRAITRAMERVIVVLDTATIPVNHTVHRPSLKGYLKKHFLAFLAVVKLKICFLVLCV